MENPINILIQNICDCFVNDNLAVKSRNNKNASTLIRVHKEHLNEIGDVSFPINETIWQNNFLHLNEDLLRNLSKVNTNAAADAKKIILENATHWLHPVQELAIQNERCALFLNRSILIESVLKQVLLSSDVSNNNSFGMLKKKTLYKLHLKNYTEDAEITSNLSHYRAFLINKTLRNVLSYSGWQLFDAKDVDGETLEMRVASVAGDYHKIMPTSDGKQPGSVIKCGLVCDPKTGKLASITTKEYISLRSSDMRLMAMHKYGIRVKDDQRFCALMERLGAAAVTVDLLEVKYSSPVKIIRNGQGSTKGASFILYNSARLETLLRTFEERVLQSSYAQLPPLDEVNLSLLYEEEEWQLLYGYIFQFPNLIERVVEQIEHGSCGTHLIIRFLTDFVGTFSVYYRRIRILTEVREHLMPYVHARIYFIKATRIILNKALSFLNIEPVDLM